MDIIRGLKLNLVGIKIWRKILKLALRIKEAYAIIGKSALGTLTETGGGAHFHEVLHLLGLSDRYGANDKQNSKPHTNWGGDVMAEPLSNTVSQTHYDNFGRKYADNIGEFILKYAVDIEVSSGKLIGESKDGLTEDEKKQVSK
ncbi:hypothetical protein GCM10009118_34250 [Wandonia haliotis]|uniref:Uncharacterized protein n=1 Tax=Wandonia haliotis TaxID=574963 RepID=A0ABN1MUK1_9FLAO